MPITRIFNPGSIYHSQFLDLRGGLNNSKTDELIKDNELSLVENFVPDIYKSGVLIKRDGIEIESSQMTEAITSIFDGTGADYFTTSTTIRSTSGTSLDSGLTSSTAPDWARFDDTNLGLIDIFVNGTDERKTDDGATFTALGGSPPNFKYIEPYHKFLFGAGHDEGKLRWSAQENAESWSATQELIVTSEDDDIVGLKKFEQFLMVFCQRSFHTIHGFELTGMAITNSNMEVGCTSHRSIVRSPFGLFWWANEGMMWSPDGDRVQNISLKKIPDFVRQLNKGQYANIHGIYDPLKEAVMMFVHNGTSTTQNRIIYYYPNEVQEDGLGTFWIGTGDAAAMGASGVLLESGSSNVYVGSASTTGRLWQLTGATDNGSTISALYETKRESAQLGEETVKRAKQLTHLSIIEGTTPVTYGVYLDDDASVSQSFNLMLTAAGSFILDSSQLDVGRLGLAEAATRSTIGYGRKWRKMKHRVQDSSAFQTRHRGIINKGTYINV